MTEPAPTVPELLELAGQEDDPDERSELLRAAEAAAIASRSMCSSYLLMVAEAYADLGDEDSARRLTEEAVEHADDRIRDYRAAAKLWVRFGDVEAARAVLERFESQLWNSSKPGYLWHLLAEGFAHDLGDADGSARCLARGLATATSVDDFCSVAAGLWELAGDHEAADEALQRAVELAEEGTTRQAWWTIANAYSRRGDKISARSTLLRGGEVASTVSQHLVLASAWQSQFPAVPEAINALRSAQRLAATAEEFLDVAEANHDHAGGDGAVRECLEQALKLAEDSNDTHRVARGFRQWLGDSARADAIAPAGLRPDDVVGDRVELEGWTANGAALLDWLRPQMTHERLTTVAQADYGMEFDRHLVALREIVQTGLIPRPLDWHPQEVLHLSRWSEGVGVDHVSRAFVCTVLCLAESADFDGSDADIAILLESCMMLGEEAVDRLIGLCVLLVEASSWTYDDGEIDRGLVSVMGLLLACGANVPTDSRLDDLAALVFGGGIDDLFTDSMRDYVWVRLANDILPHVVAAQPDAAHIAELTRWVQSLDR